MKEKNDKEKEMEKEEQKINSQNEDMKEETQRMDQKDSQDDVSDKEPQEDSKCLEEQNQTSDADNKEDTQAKLDNKTKQCEEYFGKLQRMAAEFDNYKKRTQKEKETIYEDALVDVILAFIPVMDNFERALKTISVEDEQSRSIKEGIDMVFKQMQEAFKKVGVSEIESLGGKFDPHLHNALMHVDDNAFGENEVVEEFMKGYIYKERVIRHSGVKVAN